jgi:hypothetical protein
MLNDFHGQHNLKLSVECDQVIVRGAKINVFFCQSILTQVGM